MTLSQLRDQCSGCTGCGLSQTRNKLVFGVGPDNAEVLFIGEGPGQQEDLQGEPFVGAAGQLLDDMLLIATTATLPTLSNAVRPETGIPWKPNRRHAFRGCNSRLNFCSRRSSSAWAGSPPRS